MTPLYNEICSTLIAIATGKIEACANASIREVYCGDLTVKTACGWTFTFFIDCLDLDYLDIAIAPDGRKEDFDCWKVSDPKHPGETFLRNPVSQTDSPVFRHEKALIEWMQDPPRCAEAK